MKLINGFQKISYGKYGDGGSSTNWSVESGEISRITKIMIRHGSVIDGIGFQIDDSVVWFSGTGGIISEITLDSSEYITQISGTEGWYKNGSSSKRHVTSLKIHTNVCPDGYGPFGTTDRVSGKSSFITPFVEGNAIVGFSGHFGDFLHSIAVSLKPMSTNDDDTRRSKLHASFRRKKVNIKVGSSSVGTVDVSVPIQPDFFADEFAEYERYVLEQEDLQSEEEPVEEAERVGNNVKVTSVLRVTRGKGGRFERYSEGSSSSGVEPRRKIRARGKDMSWLLTGPVSGGPLVHDVIPSFAGHIAYNLWSNPEAERKILTKYTRDRSLAELRKWKLGKNARRIVDDSGLSHLIDLMHKNLNMPLLCAFIERWQPDTNTFHMPWGEMTILLHDVKEILDIPIDGLPCNIPSSDLAHPIIGMVEMLGMTEMELQGEFSDDKDQKIIRGNSILNKCLKEIVEDDGLGCTSEVQGFLLILLGSTLFVDKTSDRVRVNTFAMLRDVNSIKTYAWGAGTLAYLYRQLGIATRTDCKGICGCLTLLQSWIFEYFPPFRPTTMNTLAATPGAARAAYWSTSSTPKQDHVSALKMYRIQIDKMSFDLVTWTPYRLFPENKHPRTLYSGLLRFIDILEPYQPDRCLRQFGYMQILPSPMAIPDKAYRPVKSATYDLQFNGAFLDHTWSNWRDHKIVPDRLSLLAHPPCATVDGYMEWYQSVSHPYLMNEVLYQCSEFPTTRSYFLTTVGQSFITRFSQYDNVDDPACLEEFRQFMNTLHPLLRAYSYSGSRQLGSRGRGGRDGDGSRGRGRHSSRFCDSGH